MIEAVLMVVRPATFDDIEAVVAANISAWQNAYRGIVDQNYLDALPLQAATRVQRWQAALERPDSKVKTFVAEIAGRVMGFADVGPSREDQFPDYAELMAIYVTPDSYRSGGGGALFAAAVEQAKQISSKMFVLVLEDNKQGRNFYEKMGGQLVPDCTPVREIAGQKLKEVAYVWRL